MEAFSQILNHRNLNGNRLAYTELTAKKVFKFNLIHQHTNSHLQYRVIKTPHFQLISGYATYWLNYTVFRKKTPTQIFFHISINDV